MMNPKNYNLITGLFFAVVAVMHLLRIAMGWEVVANGTMIPMWVSWVSVVVFGYLAYHAFSTKRYK